MKKYRLVVLLGMMLTILGCSKYFGDNDSQTVGTAISVIGDLPNKLQAAYTSLRKISESDEEQQRRSFDTFRQRTALADYLVSKNLSNDALTQLAVIDVRNNVVIQRYFDTYLDKIVTDDQVEKYYKDHQQQFTEKKYKISHIMLRLNPGMSQEDIKKKQALASEIVDKYRKGTTFEVLAKEYSDDINAKTNGGDWGVVDVVTADPILLKVVEGLKVGEVSQPFEAWGSIEIVKLVEAPEGKVKSLADVSDKIKYTLKEEAKNKELNRIAQEIAAAAKEKK